MTWTIMYKLKLLCIFAHPDDESLGVGPLIAKYADEGVEIHLICATKGERGWTGAPEENPGENVLGGIREVELTQAASILNIKKVHYLNYIDGDLDKADAKEATEKIATIINIVKPHAAITFGPDGAYGHPDHIAICQLTHSALIAASHKVQKLYYMVDTREIIQVYEDIFGELVMRIDEKERRAPGWPQWNITTVVDTSAYVETVMEAIKCHKSQIKEYGKLLDVSDDIKKTLWGNLSLFRAMSMVNSGRKLETDIFEGLR